MRENLGVRDFAGFRDIMMIEKESLKGSGEKGTKKMVRFSRGLLSWTNGVR